MSVHKRYKGRRLKPEDKDWDRGKWWMEFQLRGYDLHESIPGARTRAQAERAESAIREAIYNGNYNKETQTSRFSEFVDECICPGRNGTKRRGGMMRVALSLSNSSSATVPSGT